MAYDSETTRRIIDEAHRLRFDLVGIVPAEPSTTVDGYLNWVQRGFHGEMAYLARPDALAKRTDLSLVQADVRSAIVVGANYHTAAVPPELRGDPSRGIISCYAWGDDYHDWLASRLERLAAFIQGIREEPVSYRTYVDTGPILERELAARGGLGFVGKNTSLIHPRLGSWLFLGELLLNIELPAARPTDAQGTCGGCTRCLDACPTGALVEPYIMDARRCISYLTIELKGVIPTELRPLLGNRIFGCDICQEVCPWNRRFAQQTPEPAFQPRTEAFAPRLADLLALNENDFLRGFRGSPVIRAKRRGLMRNATVAMGNWGDSSATPPLAAALRDEEPLVRGHAAWALGRIRSSGAQAALAWALTTESDPRVQGEIRSSLQSQGPN